MSSSIEDPINVLHERTAQAFSLSLLLYGTGGESFRGLNDAHQDNVAWLLSEMLREIRDAWNAYDRAQRGEGARS
jgi:hypothetical protein